MPNAERESVAGDAQVDLDQDRMPCRAALVSEIPERGGETPGFMAHRQEPARERPDILDRLIHQTHDFIDRPQGIRAALPDLCGQAAQHQRHTGQFLPQVIVQVAADALPLMAGDLEDSPLQALVLRSLMSRELITIPAISGSSSAEL